ncbi:20_t:CDS:2 [Funneliformis mosseae]|uniref:20_t:CDS:1 n=1 Tax=Funneliformis mosseae TaxID=27381 RepID=A0A9N9FY35_FUNMO|nr:20_t:CDS:2 [Funneliformis mosseae]
MICATSRGRVNALHIMFIKPTARYLVSLLAMDCLEIAFNNVHAFKALTAWMCVFTKDSVFMNVNRKEIKLLYEEANRGIVLGTLKFYNNAQQTYESIESIKVNRAHSNNDFTFELNIDSLKEALDCMADDKKIIKMELKDHEDGFHILYFTGYATEYFDRSISKFFVNLHNNLPQLPSMNRLMMKFEQNDLDSLQNIAKLLSEVKDNLMVKVQYATYYNIFQIRYSQSTGSNVRHKIKHRSENQDDDICKVTKVKPPLLAKFFKLGSLNQLSCCIKNDGSLLLEAENYPEENAVIKVHLKGLSKEE